MANEKKRLFIALNTPPEVKKKIADLLDELRKIGGENVKCVSADNLHITLHFIGYADNELMEKIKEALNGISGKFGKMEFELGRIGAFPHMDRPRVIFLECKQTNGDSVFKLQKKLGEELNKIGIKTDSRLWTPHITLGRVKDNHEDYAELSSGYPGLNSAKKFIINSFELMESKLTPHGAEYKEIMGYKL